MINDSGNFPSSFNCKQIHKCNEDKRLRLKNLIVIIINNSKFSYFRLFLLLSINDPWIFSLQEKKFEDENNEIKVNNKVI